MKAKTSYRNTPGGMRIAMLAVNVQLDGASPFPPLLLPRLLARQPASLAPTFI